MHIRDRIKELRRVPAAQLRPHPRNWRRHPRHQREGLQALLAEIGYADALLARELPDGTLELVDGHLRAETTPEAQVPVLVLDITEQEAAKLLATLDPLAALAQRDEQMLSTLIADLHTDNAALQQMLDELLATGIPAPFGPCTAATGQTDPAAERAAGGANLAAAAKPNPAADEGASVGAHSAARAGHAQHVSRGSFSAWQVVVDCASEAEQRATYERLTAEGYACRLLVL